MGRQDLELETLIPTHGGHFDVAACEVADSLTVGANQTTGFVGDCVAFGWQNSAQQGASASASHTPTLDKSKVPAVSYGVAEQPDVAKTATNWDGQPTSQQVRRLTPTECERLQGFPDGYTQVPYRGKPASDGPRYKALGNSMAVPVMRWIGQRIQQVENIDGS